MSQPEISPLARRLAEENNVDWRGLHGSGAGGKVVERDVLEYLARVMAGEEDLDPTPEPTPDGMEAWPEEDIRSFQSEMRASNNGVGLSEIQQELSASDRLGGSSTGEVIGPAAGASWPDELADDEPILEAGEPAMGEDVSDAISEDIFLFDDDEGDAVVEQVGANAGPAPADDELLVEGEDSGIWQDDFDEAAGSDDEELWTGVSAGGDDEGLPAVFGDAGGATTAAEPEQDASALFGEGPSGPATVSGDELEVPALGDLDLEEAAGTEPAAAGWASSAPDDTSDTSFEEPWETESAFGEAAVDEEVDQRVEPEPAADAAGVADEPVAGAVEEPVAPPSPALSPAADEVPQPDTALPVADEVGSGASTEAGALATELPLVSYGTLLRRHVDVTALAGAQLAVGLELGEREPLAPAPFLLRAAAKAVAGEAWGNGAVAMVELSGTAGIRLDTVDGAASRPFVEIVHALGSQQPAYGSDGGSDAVLAVADMSALDVDEAVLNLDAPLLTLGRILYDNQRGSYRSTLSLSGDVAPEQGARLLARVAELLDAPVRLLL